MAAVYAFLYLPLVMLGGVQLQRLAVRGVARILRWRWYGDGVRDQQLMEAAVNQPDHRRSRQRCSRPPSGRCARYALWKRRSPVVGELAVPVAGDAGDRHGRVAASVLSVDFSLSARAARDAHRDSGARGVLRRVRGDRGTGAAAHVRPGARGGGARSRRERVAGILARDRALHLLPGIVAAALLCFTVSFDDYVITSLVAGVNSETLPMVIYSMATERRQPRGECDVGDDRVGLGALILVGRSGCKQRGARYRYEPSRVIACATGAAAAMHGRTTRGG